MELQAAQLISILVLISVLMLFIVGIFVFLIVRSRARHNAFIDEKTAMESKFSETLLQSQVEIQEQTLRNVSQEIHDNIGQVLSLVSLNLNTLATSEHEKLSATESLVTKAINDLRSLSKSLHPERVQQVGIKEAIESELEKLQLSGKYRTSVYFEDDVPYPSPAQTIILYRMMQEILNNIIKHAFASEVMVIFSGNKDEILITVTDNGKGFDTAAPGKNGIGLQNIYRRGTMIGAEVNIASRPGAGTTVSINLKTE